MYLNIIKKKYNNDEKSVNFEVYKQGLLTENNIGIKKSNCVVLCCRLLFFNLSKLSDVIEKYLRKFQNNRSIIT